MDQGRGRAARTWVVALAAALLLTGIGAPQAAAAPVVIDIDVDQPTSESVTARWSGVEVPASAQEVILDFPAGMERIDLAQHVYALDLRPTAGGAAIIDGLSASGKRVVIDVPEVRRLVGAGVRELDLTVRAWTGEEWAGDWLSFEVALALVDAPVAASIALSYDDADLVAPGLGYVVDQPVAVRAGETVTVRAEPGFWNHPDTNEQVAVEVWPADSDPDRPVTMSADGSTMSTQVGQDPSTDHWLLLSSARDGLRHRTVYLLLEPVVSQYVTSVYQDLFGRAPDPTGLAGWTQALNNGTPYGAVADGITYSDEFRLGLISDSYQQLLGRAPDTTGLYSWLRAMQGGMHIQQMETGFIASDEYYSRAGGSDADWLVAMYEDILGRTPSEAEVDGWVGVVRKNGRIDVARQFLYSTEYLTHVVDGYYQWLLGRSIDPTGARDWVRAIQQGVRSEAIIAGIIASDEYRYRVGRVTD